VWGGISNMFRSHRKFVFMHQSWAIWVFLLFTSYPDMWPYCLVTVTISSYEQGFFEQFFIPLGLICFSLFLKQDQIQSITYYQPMCVCSHCCKLECVWSAFAEIDIHGQPFFMSSYSSLLLDSFISSWFRIWNVSSFHQGKK
jgi:hypothetical protein